MFGKNNQHRTLGKSWPRFLGAVIGLVLATGLLASTNSYFKHETTTGTDSWEAGAVVITDDSPGSALFSATNIAPGYTETKTVTVTNASSIESPDGVQVRLYANSLTGDPDLAAALTVSIEYAGATVIYSGTLADLIGDWDNYADGAGHTGWVSAGGPGADPTAAYEITVAFPETGSDQSNLENATAGATFVWEARSTAADAS